MVGVVRRLHLGLGDQLRASSNRKRHVSVAGMMSSRLIKSVEHRLHSTSNVISIGISENVELLYCCHVLSDHVLHVRILCDEIGDGTESIGDTGERGTLEESQEPGDEQASQLKLSGLFAKHVISNLLLDGSKYWQDTGTHISEYR